MTVHCIFHIDSDGFTYSCETIVGVFLTDEDALAALVRYIEGITADKESLFNKDIDNYVIRELPVGEIL